MPTKTKSVAKSPPARRPAAKASSGRRAKPTAMKQSAKRTAPVKAPAARKPAARKAAARKPATRKTARQAVPAQPDVLAAAAPQPAASRAHSAVRLSDKDRESFRHDLIAMRHRLTGKIVKMRQASLKREDEVNPEEDGTDAFDRLFSLERAGGDQEIVYKIDEALRAIDEGIYGVCEECGELIQKPRLMALPFAKTCIRCQAEHERTRGGQGGGHFVAPRRFVP